MMTLKSLVTHRPTCPLLTGAAKEPETQREWCCACAQMSLLKELGLDKDGVRKPRSILTTAGAAYIQGIADANKWPIKVISEGE